MKHLRWTPFYASLLLAAAVILQAAKTDGWSILTGSNAFSDSAKLTPGTSRKITPKDLPAPSAGTPGKQKQVGRPSGAMPSVPAGFAVNVFAETGSNSPRQIRTAPNGDLFVMNTNQGSITVYRGMTADGKPMQSETFATGLSGAFGVNFYPVGREPQWVYVGNTASVVRFPYRNGDLKARGAAVTIIDKLPAGGHSTRDLVFSNDGNSMFVAVGSASNIDDPDTHPGEFHRANILEYKPDGTFVGIYASGIRNPVGLAIHPTTGELWTSMNERDNLGDNLVPDYITHVQKGGFYGWPYFYIGGNADARLMGAHSELKGKVIVPDVLVQAHSASVGMAFYTGSMFPAEYRNDAFAAEHGSWNRSIKAGHEVVRVPLDNGKSNGVYQDFLTGFIAPDGNYWGRPVGIATATDGSMLVTDDGVNVIWRVSYRGNGK
ncbi:MAG: sorbosone dehydrogenase family protein [Bryobacteraceae bacterium]